MSSALRILNLGAFVGITVAIVAGAGVLLATGGDPSGPILALRVKGLLLASFILELGVFFKIQAALELCKPYYVADTGGLASRPPARPGSPAAKEEDTAAEQHHLYQLGKARERLLRFTAFGMAAVAIVHFGIVLLQGRRVDAVSRAAGLIGPGDAAGGLVEGVDLVSRMTTDTLSGGLVVSNLILLVGVFTLLGALMMRFEAVLGRRSPA